jgi:N-acetylglucosamine-6-phosphate deacetylase
MTALALTNVNLVLPDREVTGHALLIERDRIAAIVPAADIPPAFRVIDLGGGWLLPGFIDTQVNGGGDVLFNDQPSVAGVTAIAQAHRRFGTTGLLPTLISDRPDVVDRAIEAVEKAIAEQAPGVLGIHIEGPHLNSAKHGIHDPAKFTIIDALAIDRLSVGSQGIRLVTLAPELAPPAAIAALTDRGVIVSAGHSTADYDQTRDALRAGLRGFTHLFNAMTPLTSRAPGMVGAALEDRASWFGLIVDGVHVHPATLRIALAARGLDGAMLVTDAMPPVGGTRTNFSLMGQAIAVVGGTCRGPDGTLAGSALSMAQAFRNAIDLLDISIVEASRLASGNPAAFLGLQTETGAIAPGLRADLVHLDTRRRVRRTWIRGAVSELGE